MPKIYNNKKYRLSRTDGANKLILLCHGGWSFSDGYIYLPKGFLVRFYTTHGLPNGSAQTQAGALMGGRGDAPLPTTVLTKILSLPKDEQDQALLDAKAEHNALQDAQAMVVERAGQPDQKTRIYNYSLSYRGPRDDEDATEKVWLSHSTGKGQYYSRDFDLMCMQINAPGAHLESAIAFARSINKNYRKMHYLACRYVRSDDAKAWATVRLPTVENAIQSDMKI